MASSSFSGIPVPPNGFGLHLHDLALFHTVTRFVQGTGLLIVDFKFIFFASSSNGFAAWFGPVLADLGFWCLTPDFIFFYLGVYFHPDICIYLHLFLGPCLELRISTQSAASATRKGARTTQA